MAKGCLFKYKGSWYSEEQLKKIYSSEQRRDVFQQQAKEGLPSASPKAIAKMKEFLSRVGVDVKQLADYMSTTTNGVADFLKSAVEIAEGKQDVALVEEGMHVLEEIIRQTYPELHNQMLNRIGGMQQYEDVKSEYGNNPAYLIGDKLNIIKLKREALVRALSETYIGVNSEPLAQNWLDRIIAWIKGLFAKAQLKPTDFAEQLELMNKTSFDFTERNRELSQRIIDKMNLTIRRTVAKRAEPGKKLTMAEHMAKLESGEAEQEQEEVIVRNDVMENSLKSAYENGQYGDILQFAVDQLADNGPVENAQNSKGWQQTVDSLMGGDEQLALDVINAAGVFHQETNETKKQNELFSSFDEKVEKYGIRNIPTVVTGDEGDEEPSNKYVKLGPDGKELDVKRRVTEDAKEQTKQKFGGKDYFKGAPKEQKQFWAVKAMNGLDGHADAQHLITAALNPDGTVKPSESVNLAGWNPKTADAIFSKIKDYLYGNPQITGDVGLLHLFPEGTKFKVEQKVYNEKKDIAGTIDLLAILPDGSVEIIDWKFMGFSLARNKDIPANKRAQHQFQLHGYRSILAETYGIPRNKIRARTIPIHVQYRMRRQRSAEGVLTIVPKMIGITFGNRNVKEETEPYLLGVVPDDQSSGNAATDDLIKSLQSWYKKIWNREAGEQRRDLKKEELNTLATAIRSLQVSLNFEPLVNQAAIFERNSDKLIEKYKEVSKIPISEMTKDTMNSYVSELVALIHASDKYANLDKTFREAYRGQELNARQKSVQEKITQTSITAQEKRQALFDIMSEFVVNLASNEGVNGINLTERELNGFVRDFRDLGTQSLKALQTWYSLFSRAKAKSKLQLDDDLREFSHVYEAFAKENGGNTRQLFDSISDKTRHSLIQQVKSELWTKLQAAELTNTKEDKEWLLQNIDRPAYDKLYDEALNKYKEVVESDVYNGTEEQVAEEKQRRITAWREEYALGSPNFYGYQNWMVKKTLLKDKWYTPEYLQMAKKPAALAMYNYIRKLNERAMKSGYLEGSKTLSFLPFIKATSLQRMFGGEEGFFKALKGTMMDRLTTQIDDEYEHSQIDDETGEQKRVIPKQFTTDISVELLDKNGNPIKDEKGNAKHDYSQLSKDLNKVISMYLKAINSYEASTDLEDVAEALVLFEQSKGHLEVDKQGNLVMQNGLPKGFPGNEKNAETLQSYVDVGIYGRNIATGNSGDKFFNLFTKDQNKKLSAMKTIQVANKLTQLKALAVKFTIGASNAFGSNLQGLISSGRFYRGKEFGKAEIQAVASDFRSHKGNIMLGLMDYFQFLPDEALKYAQRHNAQGLFDKVKYFSVTDLGMVNLSFSDNVMHMANGLAFIKNTMVVDGKLVNIREYLRSQPEWKGRYGPNVTQEQRKAIERGFEGRVQELQKTQSLPKVAKINSKGYLEIPGIDRQSNTVADYKNVIQTTGNNITGKMSEESKRLYTTDIIKRSFMMFKNWIIPLGELRFSEFKYNKALDKWDYGRSRLFWKTVGHLGLQRLGQIKDIVTASPKGIERMNELFQRKKADYFKKHGYELTDEDISEQEFYDLMRREIKAALRDAMISFSLIGMVLWAYLAAPPPDDPDKKKNWIKSLAKTINKSADELWFYYSPTSADSITRGTILPSIGILTDATKLLTHVTKQFGGYVFENDKMQETAHPTKAFLNMFPFLSQFGNEYMPLFWPEQAKELGYRISPASRPGR